VIDVQDISKLDVVKQRGLSVTSKNIVETIHGILKKNAEEGEELNLPTYLYATLKNSSFDKEFSLLKSDLPIPAQVRLEHLREINNGTRIVHIDLDSEKNELLRIKGEDYLADNGIELTEVYTDQITQEELTSYMQAYIKESVTVYTELIIDENKYNEDLEYELNKLLATKKTDIKNYDKLKTLWNEKITQNKSFDVHENQPIEESIENIEATIKFLETVPTTKKFLVLTGIILLERNSIDATISENETAIEALEKQLESLKEDKLRFFKSKSIKHSTSDLNEYRNYLERYRNESAPLISLYDDISNEAYEFEQKFSSNPITDRDKFESEAQKRTQDTLDMNLLDEIKTEMTVSKGPL